MKREGIAIVAALVAMAAVLALSLAMVQTALGNLKTGGDLLARAQARQLAEAGVDHALAYLDGKTALSESKTFSGDGYTVTLIPQNNQGDEVRVESKGQAGLARHTAVALVRLQATPVQRQNPLFGQGWISGGRITINGGVDLWGSRLHADLGYANLTGQIQVCDGSGQGCQNLEQVSPPPITGAAGVADAQCNASGNNRVVCQGSQPRYQVCPVYQTPSDPNLTCQDAFTGRMVRWDQATRISRPDVDGLSQDRLGVRASSPYTDATTQGLCDVRFTGLDPGDQNELTQFLLNRGFPGGLPTDVNQLLSLALSALNGSGLRVCVEGNVSLPGNTSLEGVTFYVGGTFQVNGTATLNGVNVAAGSGINLGDVQATNSRFYTGGSLNLNNNATFRGDSTLASRQSLTFNGGADLMNNRALLVVSEGDITFNGRADTHAFMWAGGTITFNGTGAFIGGAVSLGGTIRNGGGQFYIQNSSALNSDLPQTETDTRPQPLVLSRR